MEMRQGKNAKHILLHYLAGAYKFAVHFMAMAHVFPLVRTETYV